MLASNFACTKFLLVNKFQGIKLGNQISRCHRFHQKRQISRSKTRVNNKVNCALNQVDDYLQLLPDVSRQLLILQDVAAQQQEGSRGLLYPLTSSLEQILKFLQSGLEYLHVPYTYGWSIILLTVIIKVVTFPLTRTQVESAMAMQAVKPRVDAIKRRFKEDKDRIQQETARLYAKASINPLAGCLPSLATIPIFLGLYRSLTNVADEGLLDQEGFYWLPSLAGPTSVAARQAGTSMSWLYPFVDGHPPVGWDEASKYLILPVLLVLIQYLSTSIISPPVDPNDENANTQKILVSFLPLFIGWFALNLPSGLSLYYFSNIALSSAQQIYFRKLGGIEIEAVDLGPINKPGSGRRRGKSLSATEKEFNQIQGLLDQIEKEKKKIQQERQAANPLASQAQQGEGGQQEGVVAVEGESDKGEGELEEGEGEGGHAEVQSQQERAIQNGNSSIRDLYAESVKPIDKRCKRKKQIVGQAD
eukprot:TRINITY_DN53621_c0_g1_i1.p1 TRINITY_DN53621_c0_g1~~TRINITY_DN53621_c0_g1_i1.p1  ORF type:complete len:487 (+),score=59.06 TRINITY_DN53621_c0_g1_i1:38-1462(+)